MPQDSADHKFLVGDRWVCKHGAAYIVDFPGPGEGFRRWKRLGWLGSLFARRAAKRILDDPPTKGNP